MTVETPTIRLRYQGDGSSVNFPIDFMFYDPDDITVYLGTAKLQSGYSISGAGSGSGTLTLNAAPAAGVVLQVILTVPFTQLVKLADGTGFPSDTLNEINDRAIQAMLRLSDLMSRAIIAPDADNVPNFALPIASQRLNTGMGFDSVGNLSLFQTLPSGTLSRDAISSFLKPQTLAEQNANVVPVAKWYDEGNWLRYGADPNGILNSDAALAQAIAVACMSGGPSGIGNHGRVYMPKGIYKLTSDNPFRNPTTVQRGIIFEGDGIASTVINFYCGTTVQYLFDGAVGEQSYLSATFRDMCFQGDTNQYTHGFSWYNSQGWRFTNVWFINFSSVWESNGNTNGDSLKCITCKVTQWGSRVFIQNNEQSLNNEFHSCDFESGYGDMFRVGTGGGGALRVYGGSLIMDNAAGNTTNHYLLRIDDGASVSDNNGTYTFFGMQTELHDPHCCLVYSGATGAQAPEILFDAINNTETNGARITAVNKQSRITFRNSILTKNQGSTYQVVGPVAGGDQYGDPGTIVFENCEVPVNLSTFIDLEFGADSLLWGYAAARNCYWTNNDNGVARTVRYAIDFDMNWMNGGRSSHPMRVKRAYGKPQNRSWPDNTTAFDWTINLPVGALITKIVAYRPATGAATAYTLLVGNGDKSTTYATSGASTCNAAQTLLVDNSNAPANWINAGSTTPNNQVRLWATTTGTGTPTVGQSGYFYVEYL